MPDFFDCIFCDCIFFDYKYLALSKLEQETLHETLPGRLAGKENVHDSNL